MSKTNEYWKLREMENRQRLKTLEFIDSYNKQIDIIYRNMLDSVQKEIDAFYGKYASDEGITIAEAKKRVAKLDIEAYGRKAKRYVANKTFTDKANAEMKIYNLTMKVNRLELLKSNIGLELVNGFDDLEKYFTDTITDEGIKEFRRQAGILGDTVVDTDEDKRYRKQAERIARASFHNATFSDRIWMHQDLLRNEIDKSLQQALISGRSMERLARDIRNAFGTSTKNAQRLMRTEIRRMQTDVAMESYKRNGNERYEYMALGQRPCDACRALDGKVFNVKDMEVGLNAPPAHPNCMCSTAPYVDEKAYQEWLDSFDENVGNDVVDFAARRRSRQAALKNKDNGNISFGERITDDQRKVIEKLSEEYSTRLKRVQKGSSIDDQARGIVTMFGEIMHLNSKDVPTAFHEFAHTLASTNDQKLGLTKHEEFWKEIRKIKRAYRKDVDSSQDTRRWISSYEHSHKSIDEFFAEAFAHAQMREYGIKAPSSYGNDYTYSQQVLEVTKKYFGKGGKYSSLGFPDRIKRGIIIATKDTKNLYENDIAKQKSSSLRKGIRSYHKHIEKHQNYIRNPKSHVPVWDELDERQKNGLIRHWEKEIKVAEQSIKDRISELKKRGDYYE